MKKDQGDPPDTSSNNVVSKADHPNPIQKLIQGFCSPQKMEKAPTLDDDEDKPDHQYLPDLSSQKPVGKENIAVIPVKIRTTNSEEGQQPASDPVSTSEIVTEKKTRVKNEIEQKKSLEDGVSNVMIAHPRNIVESFIIACIVALATVLSLKKLGIKTFFVEFSIDNEDNDL
mmetsp:Transcript_10627/g.25577  ORF Transcript_10627/g.25577 Transcript_10627/m.25577 type:complete len:172 (+) Transcript_10627:73-588(+)